MKSTSLFLIDWSGFTCQYYQCLFLGGSNLSEFLQEILKVTDVDIRDTWETHASAHLEFIFSSLANIVLF